MSEEAKLKDRLLRLQADFDNYRKRMAREFIENREQAAKDVMEAMLTPLDHLDHALSSLAKTAGEQDPSYQGVRLVRTEFRSVMERFGLKGIETLGKAFDPTLHEALGAIPSAEAKEGDVAIEVRAGYMLGNRVLRAAQVMVAQ
ncbi:MAG: nucleotide exchange factor GrpE [Kiritimatiellaeota bacterium]|nr:nucleotide exchange factor GrpE [Kiritimatiellota bacterium]